MWRAGIIPLCLVAVVLLTPACGPDQTAQRSYRALQGKTMGTTYSIRYFSFDPDVDIRDSVEAILRDVNDALSTYIPTSHISRFNETGVLKFPVDLDGRTVRRLDGYFMSNIYESFRAHRVTEGAFDPTVGPLVEAWGFGSGGRHEVLPDSGTVEALRGRVGMQYVEVDRIGDTLEVRRTREGVRLDCSAVAKGFGVDMLCFFLEQQSIFDYYVEIGGELRVAGDSPRGGPWILGINTPRTDAAATDVFARVSLQSAAMATSGNYRNYYLIDGQRVWHSINPVSGFPERNNLLSATVVHPQCMTADALATGCMILGVERALAVIEGIKDAEVFLIFEEADGTMTTAMSSGFQTYLIDE
ncbi:MAG: FAD:protein FMN transferase [Saprospiraceae bacterium]|nr:FAD:protein FMN transferase [Saprospiraceae bacterium]